jgi:hypothetical protein
MILPFVSTRDVHATVLPYAASDAYAFITYLALGRCANGTVNTLLYVWLATIVLQNISALRRIVFPRLMQLKNMVDHALLIDKSFAVSFIFL